MKRPLLWLALACHLFFASSYALSLPVFEGPDENDHFRSAWYLANARRLPIGPGFQTADATPLDVDPRAHQPPAYYALAAAWLVATGGADCAFTFATNPAFSPGGGNCLHLLHGGDEPWSAGPRILLWLRFGSVLLGAISLLLVHRVARIACPDRPLVADVAALLAACLPMWSFQHGVMHNDNLATPICTAALLLLVRAVARGDFRWPGAAGIGALTGIALLTKATAAFLVPLILLAGALIAWRSAAGRRRTAIVRAVVAVVAAIVIASPLFAHNVHTYGDLFAMKAHDAAFPTIPPEMRWQWLLSGFLPNVFLSLLGNFGWYALPPHPALAWAGGAVTVFALAGLVRLAADRAGSGLPRPFTLLLATCALVFAAAAWFNLSAPQPQGRLLFPAIGPAATLLAAGLLRAAEWLPRAVRGRWWITVPPLVAAVVLFAWFTPRFDRALAVAPPHHASIVPDVTATAAAPAIEWLPVRPGAAKGAPPTLGWRDGATGVAADAPYSLYVYDDTGRIWLASFEWGSALRGGECTLSADAWSFVPTGRDLWFVLRRVPDWRAGENLTTTSSSAPLRFRRD